MAQAQRYKLKLSKLQFCSLVDTPAQPNAKTLLIKRKGAADEITATARFAKLDDELGLAFFWAFTTTNNDGTEHYDLQGDQVTDFVKAAMDYMAEAGGAVDEMHDGVATEARVVFAMPLTPDIAKAYGLTTKQYGLMIAIKPTTEQLAKLKTGEYNGVSIAGLGERVPVDKARAQKAQWTASYIDDLPDSSFLYIEPGGKKDDSGKTTPRSLRHFPYKDSAGKIDIDHLRDAAGRIPQSSLPGSVRDKLQVKAEKLIADQHDASKRLRKEAVLTSETDGHVHVIDLDQPASYWCDSYQTSYQNSEGADQGHSHAWVFDAKTGAIAIGMDSGHDHTVAATVPADVLAVYNARDAREDAANLAEAAAPTAVSDAISDGIPMVVPVEESSGSARVVVINARAPQNKSTHRTPTSEATDMKTIVLTEAQHAHYSKLSATEQEAFVNKSAAERDAEVQKALDADPIVFKGEKTGIEVRKSQGDFAMKIAKQAEENAVTMAKQAEEIAKRDAAIRKAAIRKRAAEVLGNMPGDDETHDFIIERLDIEDPKAQKALETLKGIVATSTIGKRAAGVNGSTETVVTTKQDAFAALKKGLETFCTEQKIAKVWTDGLDAFVKTAAGKALYDAHEALKAA